MSTLTPQQEFDLKYISSYEICKLLGVHRSSLVAARKRGRIPPPIVVGGAALSLWEREVIRPYLDQWKLRRELFA